MSRHVDVAVIGAGSAGLSAFRQIKKETANHLLIDSGPLGTTCARVGCMPSKALIHIAKNYHERLNFDREGIEGAETLHCNIPKVLNRVRELRDRFANGMVKTTRELAADRLICGRAVLKGPNCIQVGHETIRADKIILAPGGRPIVPRKWQPFSDRLLTANTIFEQEDLPQRIAVIGLGAIGLELGQALSRLGLTVTTFNEEEQIGTLSDPEVAACARETLGHELKMHVGARAEIESVDDGFIVKSRHAHAEADTVLLAMGIRPNLDNIGLEELGVTLDDHGVPPVDPQTSQIADLPVYLAGDANGFAPVLHEALDEGFIAGRHSMAQTGAEGCTRRRTPLRIVYSDPQCAVVGASYKELQAQDILIGSVSFTDQSRAILENHNAGQLRVYVEPSSGRLLGAEGFGPDVEHLAHLLALAIQQELTVFDMLQMPFYHPTVTEALRSALRDVVEKLPGASHPPELKLCESCPESPLT